MRRLVSILFLCSAAAVAQDSPLESVAIDGSQLSREFVLELAGLKLGAPINEKAIDAASVRLRDSGLFESVGYQWKTGPKGGYAVTLTVQDQTNMVEASIDIPGVDGEEAWKWLAAQYPQFNHYAPKNDAADAFLARKIGEHYGQKLAARMETDFTEKPPRLVLSFQPEDLPHVGSMTFHGQKLLTQDDLAQALAKEIDGRGFTDRALRQVVQLNLRRVYDDHGIFRAHFDDVASSKTANGTLAVTVAIEEGPQFRLGKVDTSSAGTLSEAVLKAGGFHSGVIANWTDIQRQLFDSARPIKRQGYLEAIGVPERTLHDAEQIVDLTVTYKPGPLYHFGKVQFNGLTPPLEEKARSMWTAKPGEPFDSDYPNEFVSAFYRAVDGTKKFNKVGSSRKAGAGDHVMDLILSFEMK